MRAATVMRKRRARRAIQEHMALSTCPACDGFVPTARAACPHCGHRSRFVRLAQLLGGGAFLMTLMACYGAMPHEAAYGGGACPEGDRDGDGVCPPQDCNDGDPAIYPGGNDPDLDGIDQNCDGVDGWRDPATVAAPAPDAGVPPVDAGP